MKQRYIPDFPEMMRLSETNYAQLQRLLPRQLNTGCDVTYQVKDKHYRLCIEESTRYTTRVKISQLSQLETFLELPTLSVRLYHDARVAEVCSTQHIYHFKGSYDYPNKKLYQRDEKHQINQFLAEWLRYCLVYGAMAEALC